MKERYTDIYGSVAIITRRGNRAKLTVYTCYGDTVVSKWYDTYRGAKIALGRYGEGMFGRDER